MPKFSFMVTLEVDDTSELATPCGDSYGYEPTWTHAREYVREAVETYGGSRHPHDPFFSPKRVKVSHARRTVVKVP